MVKYGTVQNSGLINSINWKVRGTYLEPAVFQTHFRFCHYSCRFHVINEPAAPCHSFHGNWILTVHLSRMKLRNWEKNVVVDQLDVREACISIERVACSLRFLQSYTDTIISKIFNVHDICTFLCRECFE